MDENKIKKIIAQELNNGKNLSQIQDLLKDEYQHQLTFLELRLLATEVESIDWKSFEEQSEETSEEDDSEVKKEQENAETAGATQIEVSSLVRPGALTHGTVRFISGASAEWILENSGRLGLDNIVGKPTENDLADFQVKLQQLLSNK